MSAPPPPRDAPQRVRLLLAGAITLLLAALVAGVIVLSGGDEERSYDPAPAACIEDWNGDPAALVLGQHQATAHRYSEIQVVRFGPYGEIRPAGDTGAPCGIVFASSSLDSELAAAALIKRPKAWAPLSREDVPSEVLSDLQLGAQDGYNATISAAGVIEAL